MSQELGADGNKSEILDEYFKYTNEHRKIIEYEFDSQFEDYRDKNEEERIKQVNDKLSKLPIHEKLQKLNLNDVMMDFDATSLYPSAIWDENSVYPKIETRFAFNAHMNKTSVDAFNNQSFNQDGNDSDILRIKYYNPPSLIVQHLPVREKVKK